ncbi:hypothetical protein D9757_005691 [Collybiopsis confluens]|uniref:C2H2-type domain-containing protein n=1 Tax=Collybiopsis confluens TaxID=2823264 RepID=A0A8H5MCD0_9AGAR|nr:hypothetical protein D9757_005691 [Collybiopsis confluens]
MPHIPLSSPVPNQGQLARKRHICPTCDRCFTTSGHLARHSRVHTGEKNHKCPFPGCDTRCSRQDNLQQHYRIHLSPGSRRTSSRSAVTRRGKRAVSSNGSGSVPPEYDQPPLSPPPLVHATIPTSTPSMSPSPLEPSRSSGAVVRPPSYSPPPNSPPPLAQATISSFQQRPSPSSSVTSSPETSYAPGPSSFPTNPSASVSPPLPTSTPNYVFRTGATAYQDQSGFANTSESYSPSEGYANAHYSLPRIDALTSIKHGSPPLADSSSAPAISHTSLSRHSISHISHSQSAYPRLVSSLSVRPSTRPPSPTSSHSQHSSFSHSGPPTPNGYSSFDGESSQSSPHEYGAVAASPVHNGGPILEPSLSRYSPPPVLAPIQGFASHDSSMVPSRPGSSVRIVSEHHYDRKSSAARNEYSDRYSQYEPRYASEEPRYRSMYGLAHERSDLSSAQAYMSHQVPQMANYHLYASDSDVSLHHGAWKTDHLTSRSMKSINALVQ